MPTLGDFNLCDFVRWHASVCFRNDTNSGRLIVVSAPEVSLAKKVNPRYRVGSSSDWKYMIGGAVEGGVLVLVLLALLSSRCRKRSGKKDLEHSGSNRSEG